MELSGLDLERTRNSEYYQFFDDVDTIVTTITPKALNIVPSYAAFTAEKVEIDKLFQKEQGSKLTPLMEKADLRRDRAITGIVLVVNGFTYYHEEGWSQPALLLQSSINKYGSSIPNQSFIAETAIINNLLGDWDNTPELQDALKTFRLQPWAEELRTSNKLFNKLFMERNAEFGGKLSETMVDRRRQISNAVYYKLRDKLLANAEINDLQEPWATAVNQLRALIATYNTLLASRAVTPTDMATPPTE